MKTWALSPKLLLDQPLPEDSDEPPPPPSPADPVEQWRDTDMIRHCPAMLLTGVDWWFALAPSSNSGLILAVAHGGSTMHIPVSTEEAQAAATDLVAAFGGQVTWASTKMEKLT